jgi:hypothetical protein
MSRQEQLVMSMSLKHCLFYLIGQCFSFGHNKHYWLEAVFTNDHASPRHMVIFPFDHLDRNVSLITNGLHGMVPWLQKTFPENIFQVQQLPKSKDYYIHCVIPNDLPTRFYACIFQGAVIWFKIQTLLNMTLEITREGAWAWWLTPTRQELHSVKKVNIGYELRVSREDFEELNFFLRDEMIQVRWRDYPIFYMIPSELDDMYTSVKKVFRWMNPFRGRYLVLHSNVQETREISPYHSDVFSTARYLTVPVDEAVLVDEEKKEN